MKHKHAEMIKAKADNMELVVLCKDSYDVDGNWDETNQLPIQDEFDYFLCHPKHETAVRHALNGGSIELRGMVIDREVTDFNPTHWSKGLWYMRDDFESSIKPKKEKRWIFIDTQFGFESSWCSNAYPTRELAMERMKDWTEKGADVNRMQIIEIEIEVD